MSCSYKLDYLLIIISCVRIDLYKLCKLFILIYGVFFNCFIYFFFFKGVEGVSRINEIFMY